MNTTKRLLDISPRTTLRVSEVERLIRLHRIVVPPLSRRQLYGMCEEGIFESKRGLKEKSSILIFEDSFLKWVEELSKASEE